MAGSDKEAHTLTQRLRYKLPKHDPQKIPAEATNDVNVWFGSKFPDSARLFGAAFLQATYTDSDGLPRFIPAELNIDFFAHCLCGDPRLGHRVVYYEVEDRFYFFDPCQEAYCPTSEDKLEALLSNYLIQCAQECGWAVEIRPLFGTFREHKLLKKVIKRANALLAADQTFFSGEHGNRRLVDGKIMEPTAKPSYALFVEKTLVRKDEHAFTVAEAFSRYFQFCQVHSLPPLTRAEFKALVAEVIREQFQLGLRRDVMDDRGKQQEGWRGLACDLDGFLSAGRN